MSRKKQRATSTIVLCAAVLTSAASASGLDDFETSATTDRSSGTKSSASSSGSFFGELLGTIVSDLLSGSGSSGDESSAYPGDDLADTDQPNKVSPHAAGEFGMPWLRLDVNEGRTTSGAQLEDLRMEAGISMVGVLAQSTRLREHDPFNRLDFDQAIVMFRGGASDGAINLGVGEYRLTGAKRSSATALHLGLVVSEKTGWGGEYRWTSAHGDHLYVDDHQLTFRYSSHYYSVQGGYRLLKSPGEELHGPFFGASLHY